MADSTIITVNTPLLQTGCTLGEGPLYEPGTGVLHFVDIAEKRVYHYDTHSNKLTFDQFDESVTALSLRRNGEGLACVTATGLALIVNEPDVGAKLVHLSQPLSDYERRYTRFNDAACDARGRFLVGTLQSRHRGNEFGGKLYQYDHSDGSCKVIDDQDITDGNGIGWSEDNSTLYFTNSRINKIYAYDYDLDTGSVRNRRDFVDGESLGLTAPSFCDGLCIDSEGCIWSARWGGSKIVRFNQEGTEIIFEIKFPSVYSVTACCFGGPDNDQLYVTTANPSVSDVENSDEVFQQFPDSGHLFRIDFQGRFKGGIYRHPFAV